MSPQHITSRQNVRVKEAAKLRLARQRERQGRFLIDGPREILRALDAGIEIVEAFTCPALCRGEEAQRAADHLAQAASVAATVTEDVFEKLRFGERTGGVLAVAQTPRRSLADLALPPAPLVVVIEGLEKPGNVGAVLRSADGAGVDAVIVADARGDLFNPNTIRASLGTVFGANVCLASTEETLAWLAHLNVPIVTARPEATADYTELDYRQGAAIVLGSEAAGLSDRWRGAGMTAVRLPMRGIADSLNVSATAAVLFYEAQRQRQTGSDRAADA
jgi:TrmH family RNA methyltransferase